MKVTKAYWLFLLPFLLLNKQQLIAQQQESGLLWQLKDPGKKKPSYLFGTIHIQDKRVFAFDKLVEEKLLSCKGFAMELLLDELDQGEVMKSMLLEGTTLDKLLSPVDYAIVDAYFQEKMGVSLQSFNMLKPFFVYSQLLQNTLPQDNADPLDMYLLKKARAAKMNAYGIESLSDQLGAIATISVEEQAKLLLTMVADTATNTQQFDDVVNTYLAQDLAKMIALSNDPALPSDFNLNFLNKRNEKMADRIAELCKKETTFSAIGAAHLGGEKGVLQLLRNKGFQVEAIKFSFKQ